MIKLHETSLLAFLKQLPKAALERSSGKIPQAFSREGYFFWCSDASRVNVELQDQCRKITEYFSTNISFVKGTLNF